MRRPQRPFAVEVKRGKKSAASAFPVIKAKQTEPEAQPLAVMLAEAKFSTRQEQRPELERARPQRRILESIAPAPVAPSVIAASVIAVVGEAPLADEVLANLPKRRRGRPAKTEGARLPRREPVLFKPAPREALRVVKPEVASAAPLRQVKPPATASAGHGHVTHEARAEQAGDLRRGDRWKRRLPKVLW